MSQYKELTLVKPSLAFEAEYVAMIHEFLQTDEAEFNNFPLALSAFSSFLAELADEEQGKYLLRTP